MISAPHPKEETQKPLFFFFCLFSFFWVWGLCKHMLFQLKVFSVLINWHSYRVPGNEAYSATKSLKIEKAAWLWWLYWAYFGCQTSIIYIEWNMNKNFASSFPNMSQRVQHFPENVIQNLFKKRAHLSLLSAIYLWCWLHINLIWSKIKSRQSICVSFQCCGLSKLHWNM